MKRAILFLSSLCLLASCGETSGASSSVLSLSSSGISSEPIPSSPMEESSSEGISSSSSTPRTPSVWDEAGEAIGDAVIDSFGWDFPYLFSDNVEAKKSIDAFGDNELFLFLSYEDEETDYSTLLNDYAMVCVSWGYTVEYTTVRTMDENYIIYEFPCYYADIDIDEEVGFELTFLEGAQNGVEGIGIYAITYPLLDENAWPTNFVTKILGYDVPAPDGEYTYSALLTTFEDDGTPYAYIYAEGMYEEDVEPYVDKLIGLGYTVYFDEDDYGYTYYMALDKNHTHVIQFGYDYEDYLGTYFAIYAYDPTPEAASSSAE